MYRAAARNHELEETYVAQRDAQRTKRTDDDRTRRQRLAEAFFADPSHAGGDAPAADVADVLRRSPTAAACCSTSSTDLGLAKDVPAEAHRRFRADQRSYQEKVRQDQVVQAALHEEKKQFLVGWIAEHGTEEQKTRQAAGLLPMAEAVARITDLVFAPIAGRPIYRHDGAERLTAFIRTVTGSADVVITRADVVARSTHAVMATADEWTAIREMQQALPEAHVVLRHHQLRSRASPGRAEPRRHRRAGDHEVRPVHPASRVHRVGQAVG